MTKSILACVALLALAACQSANIAEGERFNYRCDGGKAFSYRRVPNAIEVFASGQTTRLGAGADGAYSNGEVSYAESGGRARLTGVTGGPFENCTRRSGWTPRFW